MPGSQGKLISELATKEDKLDATLLGEQFIRPVVAYESPLSSTRRGRPVRETRFRYPFPQSSWGNKLEKEYDDDLPAGVARRYPESGIRRVKGDVSEPREDWCDLDGVRPVSMEATRHSTVLRRRGEGRGGDSLVSFVLSAYERYPDAHFHALDPLCFFPEAGEVKKQIKGIKYTSG